jgi:hypothetical protein
MGVRNVTDAQAMKIDELTGKKLRFDSNTRQYTIDESGEVLSEGKQELTIIHGKLHADKKFMAYYAYNSKILEEVKKYSKDKNLRTEIKNEDGFEIYKILNSQNMIILSIMLKFNKFFRSHSLNVYYIITAGEFEVRYDIRKIKEKVEASRMLLLQDPLIQQTKCSIMFKPNI